jgi:hypothetical protein
LRAAMPVAGAIKAVVDVAGGGMFHQSSCSTAVAPSPLIDSWLRMHVSPNLRRWLTGALMKCCLTICAWHGRSHER